MAARLVDRRRRSMRTFRRSVGPPRASSRRPCSRWRSGRRRCASEGTGAVDGGVVAGDRDRERLVAALRSRDARRRPDLASPRGDRCPCPEGTKAHLPMPGVPARAPRSAPSRTPHGGRLARACRPPQVAAGWRVDERGERIDAGTLPAVRRATAASAYDDPRPSCSDSTGGGRTTRLTCPHAMRPVAQLVADRHGEQPTAVDLLRWSMPAPCSTRSATGGRCRHRPWSIGSTV